MTEDSTIGAGLHPRGKYGLLSGRETPILSIGSAGSFGVPVDWASVHRSEIPEGMTWGGMDGSWAGSGDLVRVPLSEFTDVMTWNWYAWIDDEWCWVGNIRDGKLLVATGSSATATKDPDWEGDYYNGWDRWVSADGVELKAVPDPLNSEATSGSLTADE